MNQATVARILSAFGGNPFELSPRAQRAHTIALDTREVVAELRKLLDKGKVDRAKLLLLAVGHRRAIEYPEAPDKVFDRQLFPPDVLERLPRKPADYLRVVMAAGRCYHQLSRILGSSPQMMQARRNTWAACFGDSLRHALELERVIRDHDVLILGETGTGKESFARAIQAATMGDTRGSPAPASAINAAAIPETLVESELFGHVRGAFTGASEPRTGRLRSADGGSFFLDEVGDLPTTTQVKLLRVIETNEVFPVGSDQSYHVELRYIAATHKHLEAMVEAGGFRQDLFQRLAGNIIQIPPLRERPEDIVEIGVGFVRQYLNDEVDTGPIETWLRSEHAQRYAWPGNVRELQNTLRDLMLGLEPSFTATDRPSGSPREARVPAAIRGFRASLEEVARWYTREVVQHQQGNLSAAARVLGVDRSTVKRRL